MKPVRKRTKGSSLKGFCKKSERFGLKVLLILQILEPLRISQEFQSKRTFNPNLTDFLQIILFLFLISLRFLENCFYFFGNLGNDLTCDRGVIVISSSTCIAWQSPLRSKKNSSRQILFAIQKLISKFN